VLKDGMSLGRLELPTCRLEDGRSGIQTELQALREEIVAAAMGVEPTSSRLQDGRSHAFELHRKMFGGDGKN
jgi:hypothetical protein